MISVTLSIIFVCSLYLLTYLPAQGQNALPAQGQNATSPVPLITDPKLKVELVAKNFNFPTAIDFLGNDDLLLTEKNTGNVFEVINGNVTGPLLHIDVAVKDERGLLGIASSGNANNTPQENLPVYLYNTQCIKDKVADTQNCENQISRYELDRKNNSLTNPKLIVSLPGLPGPSHNGGKLLMDKDGNLLVSVGDLQSTKFNQNMTGYDTKAQNILNGTSPDGRAGILRITQDGKSVGSGILGDDYPLNLYYAFGIKNSFGIGIDPLTDNVWDTENGPQFGDEINLVKPGFNSGWEKVQGIWKLNQTREKESIYDDESKNEVEFVTFNGKGKYSPPEFVWDKPVAPTAIVFLNSDKLGEQYANDIFVGSAKKGTLFHFDLNPDRESLNLNGDLTDLLYSKKEDSSSVVFGENFGVITDLKVGPDGYLYVVSASRGTDEGAIYRIAPAS
ncbi:MAG TPA: PQQ-dependent sugar dehydrogenase [Nitrososphaeraceae archaeon]|nr:PQQ-dependent sugar dehydrogenase [Nitrososphaeraceae archaeon]